VYYIEILDLEPNPANRLAMESYPKDPVFYQCPHHIISNIAGIIRERFLNEVAKTEEHKCIFAAFQKLSDEMAEIKTMIKDNSDTTTIHVTPRN